jgi:hypothetical protein
MGGVPMFSFTMFLNDQNWPKVLVSPLLILTITKQGHPTHSSRSHDIVDDHLVRGEGISMLLTFKAINVRGLYDNGSIDREMRD